MLKVDLGHYHGGKILKCTFFLISYLTGLGSHQAHGAEDKAVPRQQRGTCIEANAGSSKVNLGVKF